MVVQDADRCGRAVGWAWVDNTNVNATLVRQGTAWVHRRYSRGPALLAIEQEAKEQRRSLWARPEAKRVPPWEWRRQKHRQVHQYGFPHAQPRFQCDRAGRTGDAAE